MRTVKQDRAILQRLVESYGKADVVKFVKRINEVNEGYEEDDDYDPVREAAVDKHIKAYERKDNKPTWDTPEWSDIMPF